VRTRLSGDSAVEISRKSRASSRIAVTSSSTRRECSRRWRATSACRNTTLSRANTAMKLAWPMNIPDASGGAVGPKQSTASKPIAVAASGSPTTSRWNVTRKLTTAYTRG
jgi:hypothetical protein